MASRFPEEREETGQLRTRKGHDMTWSCDEHGKPISLYCKDHNIPICHLCATIYHVQKQCKLKNIGDVILEMRKMLEDTPTKIAAIKERLNTLDCKIECTETSASNHFQSVNDEVNATYDGKLKSMRDREQDEIRLINEEADEEIRIINEKRERRIRACKEEAEKQQLSIKESEGKLISDLKTINEKVKKKIDELKSKNRHNIDIVINMGSKIERIKQDDKTLVNEAPQVIASLDESLISSNVHQEVTDYLGRIEHAVQRVKFVESKVGGEHYEGIDNFIGRPKCELVKSIDIPSIVDVPWVLGLISDDEICVSYKGDMFVTNINTEHTEKVIDGDQCFTSCAPLDSDVIVCGKWECDYRDDSWDRYITLYDRQWKVIRDITIPMRNSSYPAVYVDVDKDGMILASQRHQSNIYVINPADGKIVNTITMQNEKVCDEIQALSSGDIVVTTDRNVFTVISRSGEEKAAIHCDEWEVSKCDVDKLTDTLYITYRDKERKIIAVDQVSCDGNIQAKRIVEFNRSDRYCIYNTSCLVTPSGNLVACNWHKLLVYKKIYIV